MVKNIKDSIAITKKQKNAQNDIKRLRNISLMLLGIVLLTSFGMIAFEATYLKHIRKFLFFFLVALVCLLTLLTCYGLNAIFYSDQSRLSAFNIWNIITLSLIVILNLVTLIFGFEDDTPEEEKQLIRIGTSILTLLVIIVDTVLLFSLKNVSLKIKTESQKSSLRSAVYDKDIYENNLSRSLTMSDDEQNKA